MSNDSREAVEELLAPMLKKTLFVAINRVAAPASAIEPVVAEHLAYMNALEAEGRLWASGPFIEEGVLVGDCPDLFYWFLPPDGHRPVSFATISKSYSLAKSIRMGCVVRFHRHDIQTSWTIWNYSFRRGTWHMGPRRMDVGRY